MFLSFEMSRHSDLYHASFSSFCFAAFFNLLSMYWSWWASLMCLFLLDVSPKVLGQYLHRWGFSPVWMFLWSLYSERQIHTSFKTPPIENRKSYFVWWRSLFHSLGKQMVLMRRLCGEPKCEASARSSWHSPHTDHRSSEGEISCET